MPAVTPLCTQADVERFLSSAGVVAFSDHEQTGTANAAVVADCIAQASEELLMYLHERYDETNLLSSPLVVRWATVGAAYFLCSRRGNPIPDSLGAEFERIYHSTEGLAAQVAEAKRALPGIPLRCDMRPTWQNLQVDRRFPRSKTRVTPANSSTAPTALVRRQAPDYGPIPGEY